MTKEALYRVWTMPIGRPQDVYATGGAGSVTQTPVLLTTAAFWHQLAAACQAASSSAALEPSTAGANVSQSSNSLNPVSSLGRVSLPCLAAMNSIRLYAARKRCSCQCTSYET